MTRTVVHNTSGASAASNAAALLAAAEDLDVPADRVKTVSHGSRIDFSVPEDVFDDAGLSGGHGGVSTTEAPDDEDDGAGYGDAPPFKP